MKVEHLGRIDYTAAMDRMAACLQDRIAGRIPDTLLLCEHDPVFTVGRARGAATNVLAPGEIPVVDARRGGDVTYHGPGQVVGYPIFQLPPHRHDLHGFLHGLEAALISLLGGYGVVGVRDPRNTGVWVEGRKIAAIGIACRKWVTWHGFAVNLDADLEPFGRINPCGMDSTLVTRIADHVQGTPPAWDTVAADAARSVQSWWDAWSADG